MYPRNLFSTLSPKIETKDIGGYSLAVHATLLNYPLGETDRQIRQPGGFVVQTYTRAVLSTTFSDVLWLICPIYCSFSLTW